MPSTDTHLTPRLPVRDAASGWVMVAAAVAAVVMMMHHPSVHAHETASFFRDAVRIAGPAVMVHSILIGVTVLLAFAFVGLSQRLGMDRPLVRLALVAYLVSSLAYIGGAVINGLVFPRMAQHFLEASPAEREVARTVLLYGWELNQALTSCGVICCAAAITAWSLVLLGLGGRWRVPGILGLLVGALTVVLFLGGKVQLDVKGFGTLVVLQSLWSVVVGLLLARSPLRV